MNVKPISEVVVLEIEETRPFVPVKDAWRKLSTSANEILDYRTTDTAIRAELAKFLKHWDSECADFFPGRLSNVINNYVAKAELGQDIFHRELKQLSSSYAKRLDTAIEILDSIDQRNDNQLGYLIGGVRVDLEALKQQLDTAMPLFNERAKAFHNSGMDGAKK
ncbi:MAG: hypothetical protein J0M34_04570 [Alphaproteobacteria bacterium]|nr:hypothetical protein [Alphaproteobacteria bacterium]